MSKPPKNPVESYVILDDDTDMLEHQLPFFIQCSDQTDDDALWGFGLTKRVADEAIAILSK
jgi:hypothetical protein